MKCLLLLTFVALSCAAPFYSTSKSVNIGDDGTIFITAANGKRVVISKIVGNPDEKFIDISVEGPYVPTKRIRIDEPGTEKTVDVQNGPYSGRFNGLYWDDDMREKRSPKVMTTKDSKKSKSQTDLLNTIFKEYEGTVDDKSYETLLKKVSEYVVSGELDPSVYDVLKYLHDQKSMEDQTPGTAKVPLVRSDIPSNFRESTWTNKYQQPEVRSFYEQRFVQQMGQPWLPEQYINGRWVRLPEQWDQQFWQWSQPQQQWLGNQPWIPQQQWVSQQQQFVPVQQKWGSGQQQWVPEQQWVPQQPGAEQQRSFYNPWMKYFLNQMWNEKRQSGGQESSLGQRWIPQQQWAPEQVTEQQRVAYNPWMANNVYQIWNQSKSQHSSYPMRGERIIGYPWQSTPLNRGLVY